MELLRLPARGPRRFYHTMTRATLAVPGALHTGDGMSSQNLYQTESMWDGLFLNPLRSGDELQPPWGAEICV
jgi:hypothetical protein